jgi:hypothetical protein
MIADPGWSGDFTVHLPPFAGPSRSTKPGAFSDRM